MTQPAPDQHSPASAAIWRNTSKDNGPPLFSVRADSTATQADIDIAVERALDGWQQLHDALTPTKTPA